MAHDVFISHSSKDRDVADATCALLERYDIRCWVAPRDIRPGANWGASIVQAIRGAKIMVLIFSGHANASPQIKREVERAVHVGATIIPVRIENVMPEDDLEYFLGMPHWLDAFSGPLLPHLEALARAVQDILGASASESAPVPQTVLPESDTLRGGVPEGLADVPKIVEVGSFTTILAASSPHRIGVAIPEAFLNSGTPGTLLRLIPTGQEGDKSSVELYLKTGNKFTLGRSLEADLVTAFFPRSEKNDLRTKRLSKLHARVESRGNALLVHGVNGTVHVDKRKIGTDPNGYNLRERDQLMLAEDYTVEVFYDISLMGTLEFINGESWWAGKIDFNPTLLGAVRFEPINSAKGIRNSCWLFVDVGFGSAQGGVLTTGPDLAPQQGVILRLGGCFWILNLVNNEKVAVGGYVLAERDVIPLTQNDALWLGADAFRVEIS